MTWAPASANQRGLAWFPKRRTGVRLNADTAVGIRFPGRSASPAFPNTIDAVALYLANVVGSPTVRAQLFRVADLPQPKTTTVMRPTAQPTIEDPGNSITGSPNNTETVPGGQWQNIDEPDPTNFGDYVYWSNSSGSDFLHLRFGSGAYTASRITAVRVKAWAQRTGPGNGGDLRAAFRKTGDSRLLATGGQVQVLPIGSVTLVTFEWTTCPWTGQPWTQADVRALADTTGTYSLTLASYSSSTVVFVSQAWLEADGYPAPLMESADIAVNADGWTLFDLDTPTPAETLAVPQLTATAQFSTIAGSTIATVAAVPAAATWQGAGVRPASGTSPFYPGTVIAEVLSTTSVRLSRPARTTTNNAVTIVLAELMVVVRRSSSAGSLTLFSLESDEANPHDVYGHVLDLDQYGIATALGPKLNRSFPFLLLGAQAISDTNTLEESNPYAGLTLEPVYAGRVVSQEFTLFTAVSAVQWLRVALARQAAVCDAPLTVTVRRKTQDVLNGAGDFTGSTSGWATTNATFSTPGGTAAPLSSLANPNMLDLNAAEFESFSPGAWEAEANAAAVVVASPTGGSLQGLRALRLQSVAAGDMSYRWPSAAFLGNAPMVLPGMTFSARASLRPVAAGTGRTVRVELRYWSAANALLATFTGDAVEDNAAVAWVEAVAAGPAPAGAAYATMAMRVLGTGGAGEQHYADQLGIFVGNPAAYSSPPAAGGSYLQMQATAGGPMFATYTSSAVLAGITYDLRAWFRPSAGTGHDARLSVRWRDAANATIRTDTVDPVLDATGARWSPAWLFGLVAPAGTSNVQIEARWGVASNPGAGQVDYLDSVALIEQSTGAVVELDPDDLERAPSLLTELDGLFSAPLTFARSAQYVLDFTSNATPGLGWLVPLLDSLGGSNRAGFNNENYPSEGQVQGETDAATVAGVRNATQDVPFVLGTTPPALVGVAAAAEDVT